MVGLFGIRKQELKIILECLLGDRYVELLARAYSLQGNTFSKAVSILSDTVPRTTAKTRLKNLKNMGFLDFGDTKSSGKALELTPLGMTLMKILEVEKSE